MKLSGSIVALITPFENGEISYKSLDTLIDMHLNSGTNAILIAGTTGEAATMSSTEYRDLLTYSVDKINGRVPVIAGTGLNSTEDTIKRTTLATECKADYALVVTPYYNKPTPKGLVAHYTKVAENSKIPVLLYNVPSRTGINMLPETVIELSKHPNIIGVKEASGSLSQGADIIAATSDDFALFSGDDKINLPLISIGAKGAISVVANIVPKGFSTFIYDALSGDRTSAREGYYKYLKLCDALFYETNPAPAKECLYLLNKISSPKVRLPLVTLEEKTKVRLKSVLKELELF